MTRFFLIRHAQTDALGNQLCGRSVGARLNDRGQAQAERLANELAAESLAAVYTSPLERARETARPIAARQGLAAVTRLRLTEIDFGAWTGKAIAELASSSEFELFNYRRSLAAPPGGEHLVEVQARLVAELCELRERHADEQVALVSHADPLRAALSFFLGMPGDALLRLEIDPASVTTVDLGADHFSLRCLNRTYSP